MIHGEVQKKSLASSVSSNTNGTVYTITLNPKWKWSNGKPVRAQDVVFTWQLMKAASGSRAPWTFAGSGFGGIPSRWTKVQAINRKTVQVTLNKPSNQQWFLRNGLAQMSPIPQSIWNKYPHNMNQELSFIKSVANNPSASVYHVVDGPYQFKTMSPNNFWSFVPNAHYDGHRSSLSEVKFQYETSDNAELTALRTGTINVGYLPNALWSSRKQLTHDVTTPSYAFGFNFLHPNLSSKAPGGMGRVFSHLYVRQALQMGINQPGIIAGLYKGLAVPEAGPIPSQPRTIFYDAALKNLYHYDPAQGVKLLEKHGWHPVNGVMTRNGQPLKFTVTYISSSSTLTNLVQLLKNDWAKEDIPVHLKPLTASTFFSQVTIKTANTWQMAAAGGWTYEPDFYPTGGGLFASGAPVNKGSYSSHTMDTLIQKSYAPAASSQLALKSLAGYQAWAAKDLPVLWLPWPAAIAVHARNLHGTVKNTNPVTDLISPNRWTLH